MCEQTEVNYRDGEVVWVKLGPIWWPGRVKDVDELPEEILTSLKKKPIAAVKFFQEDTFEYVRNLNQICRYNCRQKKEFIKKGLDVYRAKKREGSKVMDKFPQDVVTAEEITKGDPNILGHSEFAPEERPDYRNIFGSDKKKEDKKGKHITSPGKDRQCRPQTSANGRHSTQILPLDQPRQIASPRFISNVKADTEHEIRIRHQPMSTPTRDSSGAPSPQYKCHLCEFTSSRLNVIVLHNKFHSADAANNGQSTPSRTLPAARGRGVRSAGSIEAKVGASRSRGRGTPTAATDRVRNRSRTAPGTVFDTPVVAEVVKEKGIPRKRLLEDERIKSEEEESPKAPPIMPKTPEKAKVEKSRPSIFGKRKGTKSSERAAKKKKGDEEIREKLLADWSDEDKEQEEKEIERIKQELSKRESLTSFPPSSASEEDNALSTKSCTPEENRKPKDSSCFDFDETDDANLGSELEERAKKFVENRKIPRIIDDKSDSFLRRRKAEEPKPMAAEIRAYPESVKLSNKISDPENNAEPITNTSTGVTNEDLEDTEKAFKNILEETTVPKLPEIPEVTATSTTRENLTINNDESSNSEKCTISEKDISDKMEEVKEGEGTPVTSVMDEEEASIASTVPGRLSHCKVKEVKNESLLDFREAQCEPAEENKSELTIVSNDPSNNQEISDGTVSSTANIVHDEMASKENLCAASRDVMVEKAETLRADDKSIENVENHEKDEEKCMEETDNFVDTPAMQMECAAVPVIADNIENTELNKSFSAEDEIKVKSTDEEPEKTVDEDEFQDENDKIILESRGEIEENMENIKEEIVKQEDKEIQEPLEAEKSDKESSATHMESVEIIGKPIINEPLEGKLETEEMLTSMKEKEGTILKEEEKQSAKLKVEESEPEAKAEEAESGKVEDNKEAKDDVGLISQKPSSSQMSLEDDEIELDINSMPVVMTDAIITEDPTGNKDPNMTLPVILQSAPSSQPVVIKDRNTVVTPLSVLCGTMAVTSADMKSSVDTSRIACTSTSIIKNQSPIKPVKFQTVASPSTTSLSKVKTSSGTTLISQKGGKLVVIQAPSQKSRYTVGKTTQQKVAVKSSAQQQIIQQAVGSGKVVILTKPQGGGQQKILTTALGQQHQRILTTGGKLQTQLQQRIVASTGAILTPVNPRSVVAKGGKLTPVSQQQIKALQGGKSLGTKFTMQSTQAKVILPSMQKAAVTQSSPVRVIGTLKSQSNTILIQTTQSTAVSSAKMVSTAAPVQTKVSPAQSVQRPKLLTTAGVQRITLPAPGVKTFTQAQPKVVGLKPSVAPRMVVQKVQSPATVGVLSNISQVRKVSGVYPRTATVQKISQSTTQTPAVQKMQQAQAVHKVIPLTQHGKKTLLQKISDVKPQVSKASEILVSPVAGNLQASSEASLTLAQPSMHVAQPTITVASVVPSQPPGIIISSASQSNIITNSTLPVVTTAAAGTASVLTSEQIAHVVAATPSEQVGDGSTPTYVLVTIDDSGALQPYDNSSLLAYDGSSQNEAAPRTLYIDPSSIGSSGDLENIILTIDNSAAASSTVLNLGQSSTVPVNPVSSIGLENQNSSVFNIISSSQPVDTVSSGGPNQDILAEALANTQVFQPDSSIQDSLTVVNSTPSAVMTSRILEPSSSLHQTTMLLPSLSPVLPPTNPAGVLETSLTLNQPIMTPLEVPSAVTTLQAPPPVPTSLELPLTITQPALSVPSQAFSTLTVPASTPLACISEAETSGSSVSTMPLNISITESASVPASACNPSMPLLSEEAETQNEIDPNNVSAAATASINTETDTSCSSQDQIAVSYVDNPETELDSTLEKANDPEALVEKEVCQEESSYQECDKNVSTVEANVMEKTPSNTNKLISVASEVYQVHETDKIPSSTEELSTRSNSNQISDTIISADSSKALLPEQASVESEDANKETDNSLPASRPEERFSDHYCHTLEQETESSVSPASIPSFDISKNTSSHLEDTEKQASSVPETISNTESEIALQSPNYSNEGHPLMDDNSTTGDVKDRTTLTETLENKLGNEQNPHEDNYVGSTSPSEAPVEPEHNSPSYEYDHTQESAASNSTAASEKQSTFLHSMPLLIDEGEGESANNSMEEEKIQVQKTEVLKRSSPYYNDDVSNSSSDMDPEQKRVRLESERSKDQDTLILKFNPNADDNQKISDSDDDLPPALPQKTTKKRRFEKDDIVWLQSGKDYWPALVTNVSKKTAKVYVKTVNSPRKEKAFAVSVKRLLDFDDDKRNAELLKLGKSKYPDIEKAYQRVTRFHCKKLSGKKISAARFLTYDSDDMFYGVLEDGESATNHNSISRETQQANGVLVDVESATGHSSVSEETQQANAATQSDTEPNELERIQWEIALTEEERNTRNEKAWKLLQVIKSKQCWKHLKFIYKGKRHSVRHKMFMTCERTKRKQLMKTSGMSVFLDSNATNQLVSVLKEYYKKLRKQIQSNDYVFYVMLPEALIFAIQKVDNVSKEEARKIYSETSVEF